MDRHCSQLPVLMMPRLSMMMREEAVSFLTPTSTPSTLLRFVIEVDSPCRLSRFHHHRPISCLSCFGSISSNSMRLFYSLSEEAVEWKVDD